MTSRWPSVVSSPTLAPLCSSSALVATVVPCTMRSVCASSAPRATPSISASRSSPAITPIEGSSGVDATFAKVDRPASSTATRSVNVPPTSMPIFSMAESDLPVPYPSWPGLSRPSGAAHCHDEWQQRRATIHPHTNPLISSLLRAAGSRFAGSPHPPPPPDSIRNTSPGRTSIPTSLVFSARCWRPSECST